MKKIKALMICATVAVLFSSCATMMSGTRQEITIQSDPANSEVYIKGKLMGKTPLTIEIPRKTSSIIIKNDSCYDYIHVCNRRMNGKTLWNFIFLPYGTLPFLIIDQCTGAIYKQDRNIYVKLNTKPK